MSSRFPRPSAALVIALVALFCALGGVGYAAFHVPNNSVGTAQLKARAVTSGKIRPRAVGIRRINSRQVQARVRGKCGGASAIGSVRRNGSVSCNSTGAREFGTAGSAKAVGTTEATVAAKALGQGSYLLIANPYATISGTTSPVRVTCTLSSSGSSGQTRSVQVTGAGKSAQEVAIPLQTAAGLKAPGGTAQVTCKQSSTAATVSIVSGLNALQTAGNS